MNESFEGTFAECKEQQLVFLLVRQLGAAQFELANPTITPESTRADEPDVSTWLREVASVPTGEQGAGFFDPDRLRVACELRVEHGSGQCFAGIEIGRAHV